MISEKIISIVVLQETLFMLRFPLAVKSKVTSIILGPSSFLFGHIFRLQVYRAHVVGSEGSGFQLSYELRTIQPISILVPFRIWQNSAHHHNHFHSLKLKISFTILLRFQRFTFHMKLQFRNTNFGDVFYLQYKLRWFLEYCTDRFDLWSFL